MIPRARSRFTDATSTFGQATLRSMRHKGYFASTKRVMELMSKFSIKHCVWRLIMRGMRQGICISCRVHLQSSFQKQAIRYASTSSAINRGLSATRKITGRPRERSDYQARSPTSYNKRASNDGTPSESRRQFPRARSRQAPSNDAPPSARSRQALSSDALTSVRSRRAPSSDAPPRARIRRSDQGARGDKHDRRHDSEQDSEVPLSVPHTTAASQFLYGANVVRAALKAGRRKLYQLYILSRDSGHEPENQTKSNRKYPSTEKLDSEFTTLARATKVPFRYQTHPALMDKMSAGRPHNGVILEASTLPAPPVLSLGRPEPQTARIPLVLDRQTSEDAAVNGSPTALPTSGTPAWRHPFVVMLDGITDPENVGSILRSAHFYGVDAVAVATNTCATLASPVLAKASSGACEAVRLLALPKPSDFLYETAKAGWEVYAAVAPAAASSSEVVSRPMKTTSEIAMASPLARKPCVLVLGSEGMGLRENLRRRANFFVTIERSRGPGGAPDVGVDSMNVGVAAGVLLESFMRKPTSTTSDLGW